MIDLTKEVLDLSNGVKNLKLKLYWSMGVDIDSYVYLLRNGKKEFIYFGNLATKGIHHNGDDLRGGGSRNRPNETIDINLQELGTFDFQGLVIGAFIYSAGVRFEDISEMKLELVNADNNEVLAAVTNKGLRGKSIVLATVNAEKQVEGKNICSSRGYSYIGNMKTENTVFDLNSAIDYLSVGLIDSVLRETGSMVEKALNKFSNFIKSL